MTNNRKDVATVRAAYGWALLASHAVVWLFLADTRILNGITALAEPYCWPYFESCWQWRLPSYGAAMLVLIGYSVLTLTAAAALWHGRMRLFYALLALVNLCLFGIVSLDYRLRANEFYMLFWVQAVYLVARPLRWTMPLAIVSCYVWAGTLKLNYEWFSGAVLYRPLWIIPPEWTPAACAYVVFLELVAVWGLLAVRVRWLIVALSQLALFHLQSLSQIHWFYPALMATILSWFILDRFLDGGENRAALGSLLKGTAPAGAYITLVFFSVMQLVPHLYKGDSALTGQGRMFALHMFEARQDCEVTAIDAHVGGAGRAIDLKVPTLSPRMVCDPLVYFNRAQNLCRTERERNPSFDFRLVMRSKRRTDSDFQQIIDAQGFCSATHEYVIFGNNKWLVGGSH